MKMAGVGTVLNVMYVFAIPFSDNVVMEDVF